VATATAALMVGTGTSAALDGTNIWVADKFGNSVTKMQWRKGLGHICCREQLNRRTSATLFG